MWATTENPSAGHFYPRPPRGGRPTGRLHSASATIFLSTPSARRATLADIMKLDTETISIHALREEGDRCPLQRRRFP